MTPRARQSPRLALWKRGPLPVSTLPLLLAAAPLLFASCDVGTPDDGGPLGPSTPSGIIADGGAWGSDPDFAFMDPLVAEYTVPGPFNPDLAPAVTVCQIEPGDIDVVPSQSWSCVPGDPLRTFTSTEIAVEPDRYKLLWKLDDPAGPVEPRRTYRLSVRLGSHLLGYADVVVGDNMRAAKNLASAHQIPVNDSRTLVVAFHIGDVGCDDGLDCYIGKMSPAGGTVVSRDGFAQIYFPPGWYTAGPGTEEVNVFIIEKPYGPGNLCLPVQGGFLQYGACYTYTIEPDVSPFEKYVIAAQCQDEDAEASPWHHDLQLAAYDDGEPVRVLPIQAVSMAACSEYAYESAGFFGRLASRASGLFLPTPAYASHLGLGGAVRTFSDIGWVAPVWGAVSSGAGQTGVVGETLGLPVVVYAELRSTTLDGETVVTSPEPAAGLTLTFTTYGPDGQPYGTPQTATTDVDGHAGVPWTLSATPGGHTLVVSGGLMEPVTFTATAIAEPEEAPVRITSASVDETGLVIGGDPITLTAVLANDLNASLQPVSVRTWLWQGDARLNTGGGEVSCSGSSSGVFPPSTACTFTAGIAVQSTGLQAGPARLEVQLLVDGVTVDTEWVDLVLSYPTP